MARTSRLSSRQFTCLFCSFRPHSTPLDLIRPFVQTPSDRISRGSHSTRIKAQIRRLATVQSRSPMVDKGDGKAKKAKVKPESVLASAETMKPLSVPQPDVPSLSHGLERVLFNPGVYQLQDPRSRIYNFNPYLQNIMPIADFNFNALSQYVTSSEDNALRSIAKDHKKRYVGSTSSMSSALTHFHYLLSQWRPLNTAMVSKGFPNESRQFTELSRAPSAIFLKHQDGSYAIDADREFATANVLSMLGKSMEKLLTLDVPAYERYRKSSEDGVPESASTAPEAYHYSTFGDFLMRSQLDAHDPRLPGTGMFDLKTRAVVSIRMDVQNYEHGLGYQIKQQLGDFESYEREYHDMIRAAFLKYSMQVRMGRMDGIFVAFHNIEQIFGFQYISLNEMDRAIHGQWDTCLGDQEFVLSLRLLNTILNRAIRAYPKQTIRLHFETRPTVTPSMYIFAEPMTEEEVETIQNSTAEKIAEFENNVLGLGSDETQRTLRDTNYSPRPSDNDVSSHEVKEENEGQPIESSGVVDGETLESALRPKTKGPTRSAVGKPLLALTLTVQNKINDHDVLRPENFKSSDSWRVEYQMTEITDTKKAHTLYEACKARRSKVFNKPPEPVEEANLSVYVKKLRQLSRRGRAWANAQRSRDQRRPAEVFL